MSVRSERRRPCLEYGCPRLSRPGRSRCAEHDQVLERAKNERRQTLAPASGAAAQLRRSVRAQEIGWCAHCGPEIPWRTTYLEVDHIIELADGGPDQWGNLQVLCLAHHREKTAASLRARQGE